VPSLFVDIGIFLFNLLSMSETACRVHKALLWWWGEEELDVVARHKHDRMR
jgi:hypothetical protein